MRGHLELQFRTIKPSNDMLMWDFDGFIVSGCIITQNIIWTGQHSLHLQRRKCRKYRNRNHVNYHPCENPSLIKLCHVQNEPKGNYGWYIDRAYIAIYPFISGC